MVQKQVLTHPETEFVTAHALLEQLAHPDGPVPNGMARSFLGHGFNELTGVLEVVAHMPPEPADAEVADEDLDDAREQLSRALAQLLTDAPTLEDSLRVVRARDWVHAAWAELESQGEAP